MCPFILVPADICGINGAGDLMFCEENIRVIVKANVGLSIYSQPDPARGIGHWRKTQGRRTQGRKFPKRLDSRAEVARAEVDHMTRAEVLTYLDLLKSAM